MGKITDYQLSRMCAVAIESCQLYKQHTGFISGDCMALAENGRYTPQLHLTAEAFYQIVEDKGLSINFKYGNKTRPVAMWGSVQLLCVLDEEEARERGYITEEGENDDNDN